MYRRRPSIHVFVRNKARYNPETEGKDFVCVNVTDFAGTTIGDIKEEVKRRCRNTLKIDDLFLDNRPLDDDRSVAHFNLEDGTILETTSNPFWVTCIHIKHIEVHREQKANPNDRHTQTWTNKSIIRKRTLLSVLLNSKNEFPSQPPHFPTLDDFVAHLEVIEKKGATMNPNYTGRDLRLLHHDYQDNDEGRSDDPLGSFIHRHAVRLGFRQPDPVLYNNRAGGETGGGRGRGRGRGRDSNNNTAPGPARAQRNQARQRVRRVCEDCEAAEAEFYCGECQNASGGLGLVLCRGCTNALHAGAARRRHIVTDIDQAPKTNKPYTPHAFKAPFSILVALYSGFTSRPPVLSMTEDEVKERAQPLTDTDLQDKQNGRYVGGFECMENTLMQKGFVQREDARNPTYALTHKGQDLAEQLFSFQQIVSRYLASQGVPKIDIPLRLNTTCGRRKVCLIIDEQERDRERLLRLAAERNIDAQVRQLPSGDYIWILTPPLTDPRQKYSQKIPDQELVLPYIVERKTWEDLQESVRTKRFDKQVNNMLESGLKNMFYLMEGSIGCMKNRMTEEQRAKLKGAVERLMLQNGFYVNYTASWFKSAVWLVWMTNLVTSVFSQGNLDNQCVPYLEYRRRTARHAVGTVVMATDTREGQSIVRSADQFTELIFRENTEKGKVIQNLKQDMPRQNPDLVKSVLVVQNLEVYNKRRQTTLNKCLEEVFGDLHHMADGVKNKLHSCLHNMLHYDIMSYWQLRLQVMASVYVVRTENKDETRRIRQEVEEAGNPGRFPQQGRMADLHTYGIGDPGRGPEKGRGGRGPGNRRGVPTQDQAVFSKEIEGQKTKGKGKGRGQRGKGKAQNILTERDYLTDEDEMAGTEAVFASDSQTEDFMIQQAIARSIQDTDVNGLGDESDRENLPHCSTRETFDNQKGQRSAKKGISSNAEYRDRTAFPGRGQQLGYSDIEGDHNGALDKEIGHENHAYLGQRSADSDQLEQRDALDIDKMDEDEQLRLTIQKSLEVAEQQKAKDRMCSNRQYHSQSPRNNLCQSDVKRTVGTQANQQRSQSKGQGHQDIVKNGVEVESSRTHGSREEINNRHGELIESDSQDEELQRILSLSKQEYDETIRTSQTAGPLESPVILIDSQELEMNDSQELHSNSLIEENQSGISPVCSGSIQSPIILLDSQDSLEDTYFRGDGDNSDGEKVCHINCTGAQEESQSKCVKSSQKECCGEKSGGSLTKSVGSYLDDDVSDEVDGFTNVSVDSTERERYRSPTGSDAGERYRSPTGSDAVCGTSFTQHKSGKALSTSAIVDSLMESLVALNDATWSVACYNSGGKSIDDRSDLQNDSLSDRTNRSVREISNVESVSETRCKTSQGQIHTSGEQVFGESSDTLTKERRASFDDSQAPMEEEQQMPGDESQTLAEDIVTVNDLCQWEKVEEPSCDDVSVYKKVPNSENNQDPVQTETKDRAATLIREIDKNICELHYSPFTKITDTVDENPSEISDNVLVQDSQEDEGGLETRENRTEISDDDIDVIPPSPEKNCETGLNFSLTACKLNFSPGSMCKVVAKATPGVGYCRHRNSSEEQSRSVCKVSRGSPGVGYCRHRNSSEEQSGSVCKVSEGPPGVGYCRHRNSSEEQSGSVCKVSGGSPGVGYCRHRNSSEEQSGSVCKVSEGSPGVGYCRHRNSLEEQSGSVCKGCGGSPSVRFLSQTETDNDSPHQELLGSKSVIKKCNESKSSHCENNSMEESESLLSNLDIKVGPTSLTDRRCYQDEDTDERIEDGIDEEESQDLLGDIPVLPPLSPSLSVRVYPANSHFPSISPTPTRTHLPETSLTPISSDKRHFSYGIRSSQSLPKSPTPPPKNVLPITRCLPHPTQSPSLTKCLSSLSKDFSPFQRNLSPPKTPFSFPRESFSPPQSPSSLPSLSPPRSPSSLPGISPPPRESLSPPPDSQDFDCPVLPPLSSHTSPVNRSSSSSTHVHSPVSSSSKTSPQKVSTLGTSKIDSPPQRFPPSISESSTQKIPLCPETIQNRFSPSQDAQQDSFHSSQDTRIFSTTQVGTSPNQSLNMRVMHSPAKKLCPNTVIDTRIGHSTPAGRSSNVTHKHLPGEFHKDTEPMRTLSPARRRETILIKQEKLDECFEQSSQSFNGRSTIGRSGQLCDEVSGQIVNRSKKVQQIQSGDNSEFNLLNSESPIQRQEDRPVNGASVDDAEVARKLQELFDKEYEMTMSQKKMAEKRQKTRRSGPVDSNQRNEQYEMSREKKTSVKNTEVIDTSNDAIIAQQLQEELQRGDHSAAKPSLKDESWRKGSTISNFENENKDISHEHLLGASKDMEERDRLYAQQFQEMESGQVLKGQSMGRKLPATCRTGAGNSEVHDKLLAKRLQEEEEKKVRQGGTMLEEDEALARQLSETEKQPMPVMPRTVQKRHADSSPDLYSPKHARWDGRHLSGDSPARGVASTAVGGATSARGVASTAVGGASLAGGGAISSSAVERVWHKKLFAMEKQAKKATAEQLHAVRREQNELYRIKHGGGLTTYSNTSGSRAGNSDIPQTVSSPRRHRHVSTTSSWDDESQYICLDDDGYITSSPPRCKPNLVPSSPPRTPNYSQVTSGSSGFGSMYSSPSSTSSSSRNQPDRWTGFHDHKSSQISSSTHVSSRSAWGDDPTTQNPWMDSQDFKSSQISSSISSTQSSSSCNITCGNCGEKGHNRNSKTCSRYYSLEETQHRQAKQEKARQRIEEKVQQEQQTREQLANHQIVLEDIAFRIQREKDGLSDTIKKMDKKTKQRDKRRK